MRTRKATKVGWVSRGESGVSLVEVAVVMVIVGILAAVAIPTFSGYVKESRLSEAATNIQGILEAEQAYFVRFQRYTTPLPYCPGALPPFAETQNWPTGGAACPGWNALGWTPDGSVYFRYRVTSHNNGANLNVEPTDGWICAGSADGACNANRWAINWVAEGFRAATIQPWCAVEAEADTDDDGNPVYFRGNSYNHRIYRFPNPGVDGRSTY